MSFIDPIGSSFSYYTYPFAANKQEEGSDTESQSKSKGLSEEENQNTVNQQEEKTKETGSLGEPKKINGEEFSAEEKKEVRELEQRDQEVRAHEQAHLMSAGAYARGGAKYEYETGPDGKKYASGGHVNIDTSKEATPEQTVQKAQTVKRAALAPQDPSGQDRKVAAQAARMEQEAKRELTEERAEEFETEIENVQEAPNNDKKKEPIEIKREGKEPSTGKLSERKKIDIAEIREAKTEVTSSKPKERQGLTEDVDKIIQEKIKDVGKIDAYGGGQRAKLSAIGSRLNIVD